MPLRETGKPVSKVALIQVDGKLPNIALMRLSAYHKRAGDEVVFHRPPELEVQAKRWRRIPIDLHGVERVYASKIFKFTELPGWLPKDAILGGTGISVEGRLEDIAPDIGEEKDYSLYPEVSYSIGFSQRGCRLRCSFCVVPAKEGRNVSVSPIAGIYRGAPYPKNIVLLDNDFFGAPDWREHAAELVDGGYRVNLSQGINVRLINDESAQWLARFRYYDGKFAARRLYTAWDNLKDERVFFRGVERLVAAGIKPAHLVVYMLIGYDPDETWERLMFRYKKIVDAGMFCYPMVYDRSRLVLKRFQKWVIKRYSEVCSWQDFRASFKSQPADPLDCRVAP
jgi:hypothetical protein